MISLPPILVPQLFAAAFACGLNLYATVAALGLAARLGVVPPLPVGLQGLSNALVISSAALLFLVEFVVDKIPHVDSLWDTIHTFVRPSAAALLALGSLTGAPIELKVGAAVVAGAVALAAHGTKAGLRLALNASRLRVARWIASVSEDLLAVALVVAALRYPAAAFGIATGALGFTLMFGPQLWRAFVFGLRAIDARLRRLFAPGGWLEAEDLPRDVRALIDPPRLELTPPRAARAAVRGLRGVGAYRNGWLVITADTPTFLYRSMFRPRRLALPAGRAELRGGVWADVLQVTGENCRYTLFLLKDGPGAELALGELAPARA